MDERILQIQHCMYQYSRAIYRSIKDLIDPYVDRVDPARVPPRGAGRLRRDDGAARRRPALLRQARPRSFQDIRRYFPITVQAQVAWTVNQGVGAAVEFIEEQIESGAFEGGVAHCHATTRKGKPCQRTPLPERDYCPSHQHLDRSKVAAVARSLRASARSERSSSRSRAVSSRKAT